jgi:hypothetical protein
MRTLFVVSLLITIIMFIINGYCPSYPGLMIQGIAIIFLGGSASELMGGIVDEEDA